MRSFFINSVFLLLALVGFGQENLLKRRVVLTASNVKMESALLAISDEAHFTFSYDASLFPKNQQVSVTTDTTTVKSVLDQTLPDDIVYKVSGNHLILLRKGKEHTGTKKGKHEISGTVLRKDNGHPVSNVVVYEVSSLVSAVTDRKGCFSMVIPSQYQHFGLSFNKKAFLDTIVFIPPKNNILSVLITPDESFSLLKEVDNIPAGEVSPIESLTLVRQIVPEPLLVRNQNTGLIRKTFAQFSFLPMVGTNLKMGSMIANDLSVNVLVGYNYAVNLFELGGLLNITRRHVNGFQVAGLGNLVGTDTKGVQIAGIYNHNGGSLNGIQVGGVSNILIDTLVGVQVSGVSNVLKGGMKGVQIAGVSNFTTKNVDGMQVAGIVNKATDVRLAQIAGIINQSRHVGGVQVGGIMNLAKGDVRGVQVAGLYNHGRNVGALQLSGLVNIATDTVSGVQVSGLVNYAKFAKKNQFSLINVADSAAGIPVGFVSFVRTGLHTLMLSTNEVVPYNIAFKTGLRKFYNIFTGGYGSWGKATRWSFGYGVGSEKKIGDRTFFNLEYTAHWINERKRLQRDLSLLNKVDWSIGYRLGDKFSMSVGPSFNFWLSELKDSTSGEYNTQLAPYTIFSEKIGSSLLQTWVGARLVLSW